MSVNLSHTQSSTNYGILLFWMGEHEVSLEKGGKRRTEKMENTNQMTLNTLWFKTLYLSSKHSVCQPDDSKHSILWNLWQRLKTLPKAQWTRGLSSYHKIHTNLDQNNNFRISAKHQLQNLNQTSTKLKIQNIANLASESQPRFNFITNTKHQRQNTDKTLA